MESNSQQLTEEQRTVVRESYEYGCTLANVAASAYPQGDRVEIEEEVRWQAEQLRDDFEDQLEIIPYVEYGIRLGVCDMLLTGESRYETGELETVQY